MLLGALLSKEEATVLPVVLMAWLWALRDEDRRALILDAVAVCVPLIAYGLLRVQSPALTANTAPLVLPPHDRPPAARHRTRSSISIAEPRSSSWWGWRRGPLTGPSA